MHDDDHDGGHPSSPYEAGFTDYDGDDDDDDDGFHPSPYDSGYDVYHDDLDDEGGHPLESILFPLSGRVSTLGFLEPEQLLTHVESCKPWVRQRGAGGSWRLGGYTAFFQK